MAGILHGGFKGIFHHNHSHHNSHHSHHNHSHQPLAAAVHQKELIDDEHDHDESMQSPGHKSAANLSVQAASLHVLGDFLQCIGVIVAAIIIKIYVS